MKKSREERLQRILFAVSARGEVRPIFASGTSVEAHVHDFDDVDWDDVVDGIPAEPGLYIWEGIPHPEYETDDYNGGQYVYTFTYDANSWRRPDQIEWLAIMEGACPWASRRDEEKEIKKGLTLHDFLDGVS